eukprot:GGOE01062024.1.p1 GENE.GGOE01062024.1~~GGOE01062024.1.p1  ORF type:complete len:512 (+),score=115.46 GGOE01062024.1:61-1596(+)
MPSHRSDSDHSPSRPTSPSKARRRPPSPPPRKRSRRSTSPKTTGDTKRSHHHADDRRFQRSSSRDAHRRPSHRSSRPSREEASGHERSRPLGGGERRSPDHPRAPPQRSQGNEAAVLHGDGGVAGSASPRSDAQDEGGLHSVGTTLFPYSPESLLASCRNDGAVEDFLSLADRICHRTCRDLSRAVLGLTSALKRVFSKPRSTAFLEKVVGIVQRLLSTKGLEPKQYHDMASGLFQNMRVTTDMMNEKEKATLELYFDVIVWVHRQHPLPNRALNADAKQVLDAIEQKIELVRGMGGHLYTAHVANYLRRVRERITQLILICSGRDPESFPVGLLDNSAAGGLASAEQQQQLVEQLSEYCLTTSAFTLEQEKAFLRELMDADGGVAMESMLLSVSCPLTLTRINVPARSTRCQHVQCFDLRTYLTMACKSDAVRDVEGGVRCWACPICSTRIGATDLIVSPFFQALLREVPPTQREVEVLPDMSWRLPVARTTAHARARPAQEEVVLSDDD